MLSACFGMEGYQPFVSSEPQQSVVVFQHFIYGVSGEALRHIVADEIVRFGAEAAESRSLCHEPKLLAAVLEDAYYLVIG